jgi:hypothetical protein
MSLRHIIGALVVIGSVASLGVGCGSKDSSSSGSGSGSTSGSQQFTCCINGANYTCPNQATFDKCLSDPSGCTHTGDNPNGSCN